MVVQHQAARAFQQLQLFGVHALVFGRIIAEPGQEGPDPGHAQEGQGDKAPAPAKVIDHEGRHRRRQRPAPAAKGPHHRLGLHALGQRQPGRQHAGQVGKAARLTRAEQEADRPQRRQIPHRAGHRCEQGPDQHQLRQHPAHTQLVAKQSHGNFKQRIRKPEGAQDKSGLALVQMQVGRDRHDRLADCHALDIHDHRQGERKDNDPVACVRGFHRKLAPLNFRPVYWPAMGHENRRKPTRKKRSGLFIGLRLVY